MQTKQPYSSYAEYVRDPKYRVVRANAMAAAKHLRLQCGKRATDVHHLRYPPWGTFDTIENLQPVCHLCHCKIHGKED